jgi:tight adherence protein B
VNPLAVTFFIVLGISFATLMLCTRQSSSNASARQRLVVIEESIRPQSVGLYSTELKEAEHRSHVVHIGRFLERYHFAKRLKLLLVHANSKMAIGDAVLASVGCALTMFAAGLLFVHMFVVATPLGVVGCAIPYVWLKHSRDRRVKAFNTQLPDAIDLMARSLRAGHAMGSAIEMVADQLPEPVGFEFFQVFQQQRLGLQFRDAILQMGDRVPSRDLQFLITAILVQKETGGDLTEILDRASHVIRERVRIEGEVRTHTAQGRLTGWILGLLPVIMLVLINFVSPGYSTILIHDPTGQAMLGVGAVLIIIGGLIIRKIVDVQV